MIFWVKVAADPLLDSFLLDRQETEPGHRLCCSWMLCRVWLHLSMCPRSAITKKVGGLSILISNWSVLFYPFESGHTLYVLPRWWHFFSTVKLQKGDKSRRACSPVGPIGQKWCALTANLIPTARRIHQHAITTAYRYEGLPWSALLHPSSVVTSTLVAVGQPHLARLDLRWRNS